MKKTLKLFVVFCFSFILAWGVAAFCVKRMNTEGYRPQLTDMLGAKMGVKAKLSGPIAFTFGLEGLRIFAEDVSFASLNTSNHEFSANIGKVELGMGLRSFWRGYFLIDSVSLENADIFLKAETKTPVVQPPVSGTVQAFDVNASAPNPFSLARMPLRVDNLRVINSQVAVIDGDGKRKSVNVSSLSWKRGYKRAELFLTGAIEDSPVELDIKASLDDPEGQKPFFMYATGVYGGVRLAAQARVNLIQGFAEISTYDVSSRDSRMSGDLTVVWGQGKPIVRGTLNSAYLNWRDFAQGISVNEENHGEKGGQPQAPKNDAPQTGRFFSYARLPLESLKKVDADLSIFIRNFPAGIGAFEDVTAKLVLSGGKLALDPVKARIGAAPVDVRVLLDAAQTSARLDFGFIAKDVDLGDLQKLFGMKAFMTGKAEANIRLAGEGESAYDLASSLNGIANVTAENGTILNGPVSQISSMLATVFAPGQGDNNALNCLAVRFIVREGVATDNGILIDSAASIISGKGEVDLGTEAIQVLLFAKPKITPVSGLIAPLKVEGTLASPIFSLNTANIVKNVVGSFLKDLSFDEPVGSVPSLQADPAGGNACIYTLDHPQKALNVQSIPSKGVTKAGERIKDFGRSLVNDLFGQ